MRWGLSELRRSSVGGCSEYRQSQTAVRAADKQRWTAGGCSPPINFNVLPQPEENSQEGTLRPVCHLINVYTSGVSRYDRPQQHPTKVRYVYVFLHFCMHVSSAFKDHLPQGKMQSRQDVPTSPCQCFFVQPLGSTASSLSASVASSNLIFMHTHLSPELSPHPATFITK